MELKRKFDFRKIVTILYIVAFLVYLIIGLTPADAASYQISGGLVIPKIELISPVTTLELNDHKLNTPETIVGSYSNAFNKTLLIGHSSTIFKNLSKITGGDTIYYNDREYTITKTELLKKTDIDMDELLKSETVDTVVIMTCAGQRVGEHDASHRFIVTATIN